MAFLTIPRNFPDGRTTLAVGIDDTDTTITVDDVATLDATADYALTLIAADDPEDLEIVTVTGVSGSDLTVTRGEQGTVAKSWASGTLVEMRLTAANVQELIDALDDIHDRVGTGTSAVALTVPITVAGSVHEVRANGSITNHIDYDDSGTDAVWKIRANNTTDIVSVTEAGAMTVASTLTLGGALDITQTTNMPIAARRDINTNGSLAFLSIQMKNSSGSYVGYARFVGAITSNTAGTERGEGTIQVMRNGSLASSLRCIAVDASTFHYNLVGLPTHADNAAAVAAGLAVNTMYKTSGGALNVRV
jgi:hypothetical protein